MPRGDPSRAARRAGGEGRPAVPIVVAYTPKPEGRAALRTAAAEALRRSVELVVVVAIRVPGGAGSESGGVDPATVSDEALARLLGEGAPSWSVRRFLDSLDPADDIINAAEEVAADEIVIGLRRRSPVGKLILGTNAQRILLDAGCPVLAVKAAADDEPDARGTH